VSSAVGPRRQRGADLGQPRGGGEADPVQPVERRVGQERGGAGEVAAAHRLEAERQGRGGVGGGGAQRRAVAGPHPRRGQHGVHQRHQRVLQPLVGRRRLGDRAVPGPGQEALAEQRLGHHHRQRGGVDLERRRRRGRLGGVLLDGQRREQRQRVVEVDVAQIGQPPRPPAVALLLELGGRLAARGQERVPGQPEIGAVQIVEQRHRQPRRVLAVEQPHRERAVGAEPHRRRVGILDVVDVVVGILAAGEIVDDGVALQVERAPLGVEAGPHLADLLEAQLEQRRHPRAGLAQLDAVAVPHLEVEAALDLLGGGQRQELAGVGEADRGHQLVQRARRQRGHRVGGVGPRQERVDARAAARLGELGAQVGEGRRSVGGGHGRAR
jgi:hypothetical protein